MKKVIVIGAGFAGLAAAATLAKEGYEVTVLEKNETAGGRARRWQSQGFTFDMGPSWYWMPDVFERYFEQFGSAPTDYYSLIRLNPSYAVVFGENDVLHLPANEEELYALFESIEEGSSEKLKTFLAEAAHKYEVGMKDLVYKPALSFREFMSFRVAKGLKNLHLLKSFSKYVRKYFTHPKLIQLLEFPVLFLGARPQDTPALYSLMNYADMSLGTWYPMGGMHKIVEAMVDVASKQGVKFLFNTPVQHIETADEKAYYVRAAGQLHPADIVIGAADYHHIEQNLLNEENRSYSSDYWEKRVMAPSSLLYYIGVNKKINTLQHHNLFFDAPFDDHAEQIYKDPTWPDAPLFYVCCPSIVDPSTAPKDMTNLFILIPVAAGLQDTEQVRERYYHMVMERLEAATKEKIRAHVVVNRSYAPSNFNTDYNAFKGNAYGLANTLKQTAIFKPSIKSKKIKNLYYTGQLTVPGPGVPPSIISGQIVAKQVMKDWKLE